MGQKHVIKTTTHSWRVGAKIMKQSKQVPQAYHPMFVWWAVHLKWLCRFIQSAKLNPKFRSFKTEENEIKSHKIAAMVF